MPENNTMQMRRLKVSENKRFLIYEDGTPFFWLGDTAWELFHKLDREEAELYLSNRAERQFNVVQAVALGEDDGILAPNAYGRMPLLKNGKGEYDPCMPDLSGEYSYWDHVDYTIQKAEEYGIYIAFLPTWGDKYNIRWGKGPLIFTPDNAFKYGEWLGKRYANRNNIIWVLGGDRPLETRKHFEIINQMALGLRKGDNGSHLITFHPCGGYSSSYFVHEEEWLDFNMIQSGHGALNIDNYNKVKNDYELIPTKPVLDGEPRYEDHPINFNAKNGYFDDYDIRQAAYWAVFSGAFGHTYGHHSIWIMCKEPSSYFIMHWKDAILRPGASHMKYLKMLIESRPMLERVPDQELLAENYEGANYMTATRGKDYAFIYSPCGLKMKVNMGRISGTKVNACWYNPRNGLATFAGQFENQGVTEFIPPSGGRNNDWVLILDDSDKGYKI